MAEVSPQLPASGAQAPVPTSRTRTSTWPTIGPPCRHVAGSAPPQFPGPSGRPVDRSVVTVLFVRQSRGQSVGGPQAVNPHNCVAASGGRVASPLLVDVAAAFTGVMTPSPQSTDIRVRDIRDCTGPSTSPRVADPALCAAVELRGVSRVYGTGDRSGGRARRRARDVPDGIVDCRDGTVRFRQVDAVARGWWPRTSGAGSGPDRRSGHHSMRQRPPSPGSARPRSASSSRTST